MELGPGTASSAPQLLCYLLAGAGARAVFQAGVLEELYEHDRFRHPTIFAGTSGGAINAALLAAGKTPREVRDFWLRFASEPPIDMNTPFFRAVFRVLGAALARDGFLDIFSGRDSLWRTAKLAWRHRGPHLGNVAAFLVELLLTRNYGIVSRLLNEIPDPSLLRGEPLRRLLVGVLGGDKVPAVPGVRLAINATDIRRCRPARFVNTEIPSGHSDEYIVSTTIDVDMVLGSAAIPLLLPAVTVGEHRLWDGSLLVNTPLASAISLGADAIVPIMSNARPDGPAMFGSAGDALQRLADVIIENGFNLDRKLLLERNKLARNPQVAGGERYREIALHQAIRPARNAVFDTASYLNFSKQRLDAMYEEGRTRAYAWLAAGAPLDTLAT